MFGLAVVVIEFVGRALGRSPGFVSSIKTFKGYFTVSKAVVDPIFDEIIVLVNFLLVEAQKLVFVESVPGTLLAFVGSYFAYVMVKFVSIWTLVFFGKPLCFSFFVFVFSGCVQE